VGRREGKRGERARVEARLRGVVFWLIGWVAPMTRLLKSRDSCLEEGMWSLLRLAL